MRHELVGVLVFCLTNGHAPVPWGASVRVCADSYVNTSQQL